MSGTLLAYDEALRIVLEACPRLPAESCSSLDAVDRVLAREVTSAVDLPPFDNSAMDGFALGGGDAAVPEGTELDVGGEQAAGDGNHEASAGAWEIMTGAALPRGFDRVVPVERTERLGEDADGRTTRIRLRADVAPAANVRMAGTDIARGTTAMAAGTVLGPQHLMLLAAMGVSEVTVASRARVAVICTGRELVDDPATPLAPGQIRNSNGPFLATRLRLAGAEVVHTETVGDDASAFEAALRRALEAGARIVLTTGAVSMGRYDFVPAVLDGLGARTLFHKVAIRPGKPLLLAQLPDDALLFGLPGNPIAGAVGLRFFVEPALRRMAGLPPEHPLRVPLAANYRKKPPLRFHLKSRLAADANGRLSVTVLPGQESYRIRPLAEANAWAVVPPDVQSLEAGDPVDVYGLGHIHSPLPDGSHA